MAEMRVIVKQTTMRRVDNSSPGDYNDLRNRIYNRLFSAFPYDFPLIHSFSHQTLHHRTLLLPLSRGQRRRDDALENKRYIFSTIRLKKY
ncbi:MAG: hypothetical protein UY34_C0019G0018 [Parcubacteria group bacterium GW2011_GWA2_48_9]|nr:MAG: hypothetical protein UY34_C0019G0018 [Parcubacteria group bacterium GW2011_GWA2_48_9]